LEKKFKENKDIVGNYKKFINEWADQGLLILLSLLNHWENEWKDYKFIAYEHQLFEPIEPKHCSYLVDDRKDHPNYGQQPKFKGFIDLVLKMPNNQILLVDFKATTKP